MTYLFFNTQITLIIVNLDYRKIICKVDVFVAIFCIINSTEQFLSTRDLKPHDTHPQNLKKSGKNYRIQLKLCVWENKMG